MAFYFAPRQARTTLVCPLCGEPMDHRPEFDQLEYLLVLAGTGLGEEGVALHFDPTHQHQNQQHRGQHDQRKQ